MKNKRDREIQTEALALTNNSHMGIQKHKAIPDQPNQNKNVLNQPEFINEEWVYQDSLPTGKPTYEIIQNYQKAPGQHYVVCPICHAQMIAEDLEFHKRQIHSAPKPTLKPVQTPAKSYPFIQCPICKNKISPKDFPAHTKLSHGKRLKNGQIHGISSPKKNKKSVIKQPLKDSSSQSFKEEDSSPTVLRFAEEFVEYLYADKHVGFMAREQGKFGSLPLYDDYSDEAEA